MLTCQHWSLFELDLGFVLLTHNTLTGGVMARLFAMQKVDPNFSSLVESQ